MDDEGLRVRLVQFLWTNFNKIRIEANDTPDRLHCIVLHCHILFIFSHLVFHLLQEKFPLVFIISVFSSRI